MWKPNSIGAVIAERSLEFTNSHGLKKVYLRFGQPVRSPSPEEGEPWYCPLTIEGLGKDRFKAVAGEDSLQSLLLALQLAKKLLPEYAKEEDGHIYWLSEEMDSIFDQQNLVNTYSMITSEVFQVLREVSEKIREIESTNVQDAFTQIKLLLQKYNNP